MPNKEETKTVDPEAELSNAVRMFQKLAPHSSIEKRAAGIPQLAPQKKQIGILTNEKEDTELCLNLAKKGFHAKRDTNTKNEIRRSILQFENLETMLRSERWQQTELDCLNHLEHKNITELFKVIPTETEELGMLEHANNRLRRMENRLDLATKRFCVVNADNKRVREEIHRLLIERNNFNIQWKRTINRLVKGKEYLIDIMEMASSTFADRDECCRKLETLKWKGLFQLNKDIAEMQSHNAELNNLAKMEEFLRVKGSRRFCEADEKEATTNQLDRAKWEKQIAKYDAQLQEIFDFTGSEKVATIITKFKEHEIENFSAFILLCEVLQEAIVLRRDLEPMRQYILDVRERNTAREEREDKYLADLTKQVKERRKRNQEMLEQNMAAEAVFNEVLIGINELISIARCDTTPLLSLLGNHNEVTKWNVRKFLSILETEVKSLVQVAYEQVKLTSTPAPTPAKVGKQAASAPTTTLVADPHVEKLRPNNIEQLVPYTPCAYCVEDYIMHWIYETPAVLADDEFIQKVFHLEDVNTKFGIYTLTIPEKRHPYRNKSEMI